MQARMKHPAMVVPGAMQALLALSESAIKAGLPRKLVDLVYLRVSQINGCSLCVAMHAADLKKENETEERLWTVAAWREAPWFSEAERAALALAEEVTRLADRSNAVPDDVWAEATRHYDERSLAALLMAISTINVWNRLNAATRQVAGSLKA
jgi:AhpD family alkylhydroperoxidase